MNHFVIAAVITAVGGGLDQWALASHPIADDAEHQKDQAQVTLTAEDQEKLEALKALFAPFVQPGDRKIIVAFHNAPDGDDGPVPYDGDSLLDHH